MANPIPTESAGVNRHLFFQPSTKNGTSFPLQRINGEKSRLTNGFIKKLDNLKAALALHFAWYNFGRIHQSLKVTPAMEAGITDHVWGWEEIMDFSN